eukprot:CAMPEP_0202977144 /NCGR_PEP_ID=MMETSP1396-20130829/83644_1 /ASSEMBLY_ACC=CAM_ASM_000872 /TAXON_ID= /ORGANISM="Pseudokeronopsis sp., Strain Brazil" /LENGTH=40 /DNA_ID= /DNA_START= /DNA_END= /DNA_ORIENTATION=
MAIEMNKGNFTWGVKLESELDRKDQKKKDEEEDKKKKKEK